MLFRLQNAKLQGRKYCEGHVEGGGREMSHSEINVKGNGRSRSYLEFQLAANSLQEGLRRIGNVCAEVWKIRDYFSVRDGGIFERHIAEPDSSLKLRQGSSS